MATSTIELVTIDELNNYTDNMLFERYDMLTQAIEKRRGNKDDLEIELCYVQREIQLREERQYNHSIYLKSISYDFDNESRYPMLDDTINYEYVVLHRYWLSLQTS